MIKFLRVIRQKLLSENKFLRYVFYAVGEITLVVIGILIALSLDNWNEKRKETLQEIQILKNIQEDILRDTIDIRWNIDHHVEFLIEEQKLLNFLKSDLSHPIDSINYSSALGVPLLVAIHKSTYSNLQNNQIGIISNNELHKSISRFYDFFVHAVEMAENEKSVYETYSSKKVFFQKYFKLSEEVFEVNSDKYNNGNYYNPDVKKIDLELKDLEGARQDDAFMIEINESISFRNVKIGFYKDMINRIKELNEEIKAELKVLEQ